MRSYPFWVDLIRYWFVVCITKCVDVKWFQQGGGSVFFSLTRNFVTCILQEIYVCSFVTAHGIRMITSDFLNQLFIDTLVIETCRSTGSQAVVVNFPVNPASLAKVDTTFLRVFIPTGLSVYQQDGCCLFSLSGYLYNAVNHPALGSRPVYFWFSLTGQWSTFGLS